LRGSDSSADLAAVGLLAWIAACTYLDHLPLYRVEQIAARQGVPLARFDPGSGKTRHAYLWAYRSGVHDNGPPIVVFYCQTSRAGARARVRARLARLLMVDDYVGYKSMFVGGPTELACLAYIPRKFFDVHAAGDSPVAKQALQLIAKL
jgi:hypothetical protein